MPKATARQSSCRARRVVGRGAAATCDAVAASQQALADARQEARLDSILGQKSRYLQSVAKENVARLR